MGTNEEAVQAEMQRRQVAREAAERETSGLLKTGWTAVIVGWFLPIIPIVGFVGLGLGGLAGLIISFVAIVKGNIGGGVKLLLVAVFGGMAAWIVWILIYGGVAAALG